MKKIMIFVLFFSSYVFSAGPKVIIWVCDERESNIEYAQRIMAIQIEKGRDVEIRRLPPNEGPDFSNGRNIYYPTVLDVNLYNPGEVHIFVNRKTKQEEALERSAWFAKQREDSQRRLDSTENYWRGRWDTHPVTQQNFNFRILPNEITKVSSNMGFVDESGNSMGATTIYAYPKVMYTVADTSIGRYCLRLDMYRSGKLISSTYVQPQGLNRDPITNYEFDARSLRDQPKGTYEFNLVLRDSLVVGTATVIKKMDN